MNTRAKGRKFEKREEVVWKECGWETELVRPEARFIGPGKAVVAYRDFFGRYDLIVAMPKVGAVCLIQVSTELPSSHKEPGPMGFRPPFRFGSLEEMPVDNFLKAPVGGVFELYSRYVRDGGGPYEARRQWWTRA